MALNDLVPGSIGNAILSGESFTAVEVVTVGPILEFKDSGGDHFVISVDQFTSFAQTGSTAPSSSQFAVSAQLTDYWSNGATVTVTALDGPFVELDFGSGDVRTWARMGCYRIL